MKNLVQALEILTQGGEVYVSGADPKTEYLYKKGNLFYCVTDGVHVCMGDMKAFGRTMSDIFEPNDFMFLEKTYTMSDLIDELRVSRMTLSICLN